jgi:hypothetical protein
VAAEANVGADEIRARVHGEALDVTVTVTAAAEVESRRVECELQVRRQRELGALVMEEQQLQRLPVLDVELAAVVRSAGDDIRATDDLRTAA